MKRKIAICLYGLPREIEICKAFNTRFFEQLQLEPYFFCHTWLTEDYKFKKTYNDLERIKKVLGPVIVEQHDPVEYINKYCEDKNIDIDSNTFRDITHAGCRQIGQFLSLERCIQLLEENEHKIPNFDIVLIQRYDVIFKLAMEAGAWDWFPGIDSDSRLSSKVTDAGARVCWGTQDLGNWAWGLMGAELGGGRETAMLTGGSAGIPAWWMAFVSLSLSVLTLFILYPLIYKVYHQEADDKLTNKQIERVVRNTLKRCAKKMKIDIEWDIFRFKVRELSIDVLVAYRTTDYTIAS